MKTRGLSHIAVFRSRGAGENFRIFSTSSNPLFYSPFRHRSFLCKTSTSSNPPIFQSKKLSRPARIGPAFVYRLTLKKLSNLGLGSPLHPSPYMPPAHADDRHSEKSSKKITALAREVRQSQGRRDVGAKSLHILHQCLVGGLHANAGYVKTEQTGGMHIIKDQAIGALRTGSARIGHAILPGTDPPSGSLPSVSCTV